jgi:hypothetical protein
MNEKLHAAIDEVWRRRLSMASLSAEEHNVLNAIKEELHREIDELKDDDGPSFKSPPKEVTAGTGGVHPGTKIGGEDD